MIPKVPLDHVVPPHDDVLRGRFPLLLAGYLSHAGAEKQTYLLVRSLLALGHDPGIILWNETSEDRYKDRIRQLGVPVLVAPQNRNRYAKQLWLRRIIRDLNPEILHSVTFFLNAVAAFAMRGLDGVAVGAMRTAYGFSSTEGRVHYRINRRWPRTIIMNSRGALMDALQDRGYFRVRQPVWVPNSLDLSAYTQRRHGPQSPVRILGVGNLHGAKRWDRMLRIAALLGRRQTDTDWRLSIAGEGTHRPDLERMIEELGLTERCTLLGRRSDVPGLLATSDIFVLGSDTEGTPNALMEAMASGLPIVTTPAGDASRLVEEARCGFVVPHDDQQGFADRLSQLVGDAELRSTLGSAAHRYAEANFGLEALAQRTIEAYRQAGWSESNALPHHTSGAS